MKYVLACCLLALTALPARADHSSYKHPCGLIDCEWLPVPIDRLPPGVYVVLGQPQPWPKPRALPHYLVHPPVRRTPVSLPVNFSPHGLY